MSASSAIPTRRTQRFGANLTPMIDMTFLLVVFFVLVSRISEIEQVPMELPEPRNPASTAPSDHARAVVNMPADSQGMLQALRLNAEEFQPTDQGLQGFTDALGAMLSRTPDIELTLRADRRLEYSVVKDAMQAISAAGGRAQVDGSVRVNLVIINSGVVEQEIADGVF